MMSSSQNPYINQGQGNQYSPLPAQQKNKPPTQNNVRVNLVQPSLTSQQQSKEKMNSANPSNVAKKKPKIKPKGAPKLGDRNQQKPPWALGRGNPNQNKNQGTTSNNPQKQGKNTSLRTNHSCAIYEEYGHHTHNYPQLPDLKRIQGNRGHGGQQTVVMKDPFPHQGVVNTQQQTPQSHPSRGNLDNNPSHDSFMTGEDILP